MKNKVRELLKNIFFFFLVLFWGLTIISCSSEDDSALKDGKVAANLSEADQFEPPNISLITINDSVEATNQTTVSVKLSGADAVGITGYIISSQSTVPDLTSSEWESLNSQTQYSVSKDSTVGPSDASYSFYGWMKDDAANISATATSSIIYDTTAPTISSVSINSGESNSTNTVVDLTISASDSLSGISAYYASETSTDPSATATGWIDITTTNNLSTTKSYTLSSPGQVGTFTKTVYLWVKDSAGNVSDSASDSIQLILTNQSAPTNPSISINSGASSTASSSVTLSISATDDIGVTGYYLSQTSSTPSSSASGWTSVTSATSYSGSVSFTLSEGNGTNTVYVWFKDAAGNVSSSASDSITLVVSDTTVPSSPTININSGASITSNTVVSLALSATDNVGITAYYASETSTTPASSDSGWNSVTSSTSYSATVSFTMSSASSAGNHSRTVYVWFKDTAGNVSDSASDGITYTTVTFVAVGDSGTILTSPDGITWDNMTSGTSNTLYGITYANSTFVAVGESGTILTSSDNGASWDNRTSGSVNRLQGVTFGNNNFVAVGRSGTILTSSDNGTSWDIPGFTDATTNNLYGVTYGSFSLSVNNKFVVVDINGKIRTSNRWGGSWTENISSLSNDGLEAVTFANSLFVAVGWTGHIQTSSNGGQWYRGASGTTYRLRGVTYGNNTFVVTGYGGIILTSSNPPVYASGAYWDSRNSGTTESLAGAIYGNGIFVAVGDSGTILTSSDVITWTPRSSGISNNLRGVTFAE